MSRDYKNFRPNNYYHVYNRGNNKEPIFLDDFDYNNFLKRLKIIQGMTESGKLTLSPLPNSFQIIAYCLMPNHFHFLLRQSGDIGIDKFINKLCSSYVKYFNKKYKRVGHLFQDTFKAKLVDSEAYLLHLSTYIHNNPANPLTFPYSSLPEYMGEAKEAFCDTAALLKIFDMNKRKYLDFIRKGLF